MNIERRYLRLTREVALPHPDRRERHDWTRLPSLPAGSTFVVETWTGCDPLYPDGLGNSTV